MPNIDRLSEMNPWWKTGNVRKELVPSFKRSMFSEIQKYMKMRQIIAIVGLRRTGKTTIMLQTIDTLLKKGIDQKKILYFSFDENIKSLDEVMNIYRENILKGDLDVEKTYIILDEIQKLRDWENKIKIYYDLYPNIKFLITGSASINILIDAKESLAGRIFYFNLNLLSFEEFLELKGKNTKKIKENVDLWKHEIKSEINNYLLKPFAEIIDVDDDIAKKYIKESVIEKTIFRDLSSLFEIKDIELIEKLIGIIAYNPGMIINLDEISREQGRSRQTISNYLYYLRTCFVIKELKNFKGSLKVSSRKLKKYYPIHPCVALALGKPDQGKVVENLIQFVSQSDHFWRESGKETDFILSKDNSVLPIESKYSKHIRMRDIKGLIKFMDQFDVGTGLVITEDYEAEKIDNGRIIRFVPLWKWIL
jgi:predicted AAA+ superfamily ATPase